MINSGRQRRTAESKPLPPLLLYGAPNSEPALAMLETDFRDNGRGKTPNTICTSMELCRRALFETAVLVVCENRPMKVSQRAWYIASFTVVFARFVGFCRHEWTNPPLLHKNNTVASHAIRSSKTNCCLQRSITTSAQP